MQLRQFSFEFMFKLSHGDFWITVAQEKQNSTDSHNQLWLLRNKHITVLSRNSVSAHELQWTETPGDDPVFSLCVCLCVPQLLDTIHIIILLTCKLTAAQRLWNSGADFRWLEVVL